MFNNNQRKTVLDDIDQRIASICQPEEALKIFESDLRQALGGYRLSDALSSLAKISYNLHNDTFPDWFDRIGTGGVRHPLGIYVTDFAVSYLASVLLSSKSSDHPYKRKQISDKADNMLALFHIYFNQLALPERNIENGGILQLMLPVNFEQMNSQLNIHHLGARQWFLFNVVALSTGKNVTDFYELFKAETSLSVNEFIDLALIFYAISSSNYRFNLGDLPKRDGSWFSHLVQEEKMRTYLKLMSTDRVSFRNNYNNSNTHVSEMATKTKFNPLLLNPIIKVGENDYIVPSLTSYKLACFRGIYWWFDNYFIQNKNLKSDTFRHFYGSLFEEYTKILLKDIYSSSLLSEKITYGNKGYKKELFDHIVELNDEIILFEAKTIQFTLNTLQTGYIQLVKKEIKEKVVSAIIQMYKRYQDITAYSELERFTKKKKTVVLICYDLPFGSNGMYSNLINEELMKIEFECPGICGFDYFIMDLWDLEHFSSIGRNGDLKSLLEKTLADKSTSFSAEVQKIRTERKITYLGIARESYQAHLDDISKQAQEYPVI